jgi:hypothetical protein
MPQVRMLRALSGFRDGVEWPPVGGVLDVPDAEADDLERIGVAERTRAKSTITPEAAVAVEPETAAAPKPRRTRKASGDV